MLPLIDKANLLKEEKCDKNIPGLGQEVALFTTYPFLVSELAHTYCALKQKPIQQPHDACFVPHSTPASASARFEPNIRASDHMSTEFVLYQLPPKRI